MNILVTGGAGYIGTHTLISLIESNEVPVVVDVVDNYSNSTPEAIKRVEAITGESIDTHVFDLCDKEKLDKLFANSSFDAVIHFAGLKAVGESVEKPLLYYRTNLTSTINLLECMEKYNVNKLIFSSSATVYGTPAELPLTETSSVGIGLTNPYGQTKYMIEQIIRDYCVAHPSFEATLLRYFNPIGAHASGTIGEDPSDIPNNLLPYVSQVAVGKLAKVNVFGNDYDTPDGTGVRDYIHVVDLAEGHVAALQHSKPGCEAYNLGTGHGTSVLELIAAFAEASGQEVPYEVTARRPGDIASCYCNPSKAERELNWKAKKSIDDACTDSWRWQSQNPDGYPQ